MRRWLMALVALASSFAPATARCEEAKDVGKLMARLSQPTTDSSPSLSPDECHNLVAEVALAARPRNVLKLASPWSEADPRRRQTTLWVLAQMGPKGRDAFPQLLGLLEAADSTSEDFADGTAALCHAMSRVADADQLVKTLELVSRLPGPTRLWCTWSLSRQLPEEQTEVAMSEALDAAQGSLDACLDEHLGPAHGPRRSNSHADRRFPSHGRSVGPVCFRITNRLLMAGEPAQSILCSALLKTVAVPARGPGRDVVANDLCSAVLHSAGDGALPCIKKAVASARAYSLGGRCIEILVRLGLGSGQVDKEIRSAMWSQDTGSWAADLLAAEGSRAVPFLGRALDDQGLDPGLVYAVLEIVKRIGPEAVDLKKKIVGLTKARDKMIRDLARKTLKSVTKKGKEKNHPAKPRARRSGSRVLDRLDPCGAKDGEAQP